MTFVSKPCLALGLLMLAHAGYSAHEYSTLQSRLNAAGNSSSDLPVDIRVETVVSVFLICCGLVARAQPLRPISWRVYAGNVEKEGGGQNPFRRLEERPGFIDIRAKRREFANWVKQQDSTVARPGLGVERETPLEDT